MRSKKKVSINSAQQKIFSKIISDKVLLPQIEIDCKPKRREEPFHQLEKKHFMTFDFFLTFKIEFYNFQNSVRKGITPRLKLSSKNND